ncbi:replicative DNA helicase [Vulcanimicrobium alpinum]|uniref:Replicative DNA helicase n=1 Tax=Vulcanimicrobium alpinum TaxID=3016050 RepID=A0AAN1Y026_UNVUL|nr:replicative DNA helicase [Vulcanimicrobium alpinum]BDE07462.1 replicative DNA helicase [Vulcanimicrobium alpinum]
MNVASFVSSVDRLPPNNLEAEMALLGSVLVDKEMMATVSEIVQPGDFHAPLHETIYLALFALYERGEPLDKVALAEELKNRGLLDKVGGMAYLSSLMDTVPTAASAEYYAKIVREKSSLRGLIHAGTQITQLGYESEDDVPGALDRAEQVVYDVGNRGQRNAFATVPSLLLGVFQSLERRHEQKGDRTGVTSGFRDIDDYTAGWQPGNLVILAARPAMGKTSLALNMAVAAAKDERKPVAVFSLEMTKQELVERLLSSEARLDASKLRRGAIADRDWEKIGHAMGVLHELPIYLDDAGAVTVTEIRSRLRRLKSGNGLAAVFIDYLQLVRPATLGKVVNRNEELSDICRTLKATAKDLEVPIIALAQLNRAVETRADKRPMLSDLRDCLAGEARVTNADTGERVPVREIVERGLRFNVWAVDDRFRLVRKPITDVWVVGTKPIFRVTTKSGRVLRCTDGHRFLTASGWSELKDLEPGRCVAVPRRYEPPSSRASRIPQDKALLLGWLLGDGHLGGSATLTVATAEEAQLASDLAMAEFGLRPIVKPERPETSALRVDFTTGTMCGAGKNPLTTWLRSLGLWKTTGARKFVPEVLLREDDETVAAFLRGLFHADGSLTRSATSSRVTVRLSTISELLARDVQHLLLRFGINAIVKADMRNIGGYRSTTAAIWTVAIMQRDAVCAFMDRIGFLGIKHERAAEKVIRRKENDAGQFDRIPVEVNGHVRSLRLDRDLSHASLGWRDQGKAMSRETAVMLADRLDDELLIALGTSDVLWDPIVAVEPQREETVYDLTVGDLHNFCVDDIVTHNSGAIEQEADIVTFLYRDVYYNKETSPEPDATELIIAKHRNGKVGTIRLRFQPEHTLFVPYGDESHYPNP